MAKAVRYQEGDWFTLPAVKAGVVVGLAARVKKKAHLIIAYFFVLGEKEVVSADSLESLTREDAIATLRISDLHVLDGSWPLIGHHSSWDRDAWPVPLFRQEEPYTGRVFIHEYDDEQPNVLKSRRLSSSESARGLPVLELLGAVAVEERLAMILEDPTTR